MAVARLPRLCTSWPLTLAAPAAGRASSWLPPVRGGDCRRNAHHRTGRRPRLAGDAAAPGEARQCLGLLELVRSSHGGGQGRSCDRRRPGARRAPSLPRAPSAHVCSRHVFRRLSCRRTRPSLCQAVCRRRFALGRRLWCRVESCRCADYACHRRGHRPCDNRPGGARAHPLARAAPPDMRHSRRARRRRGR